MAKTKALISCAVTASLFSHMQKAGFLMTRLILFVCQLVLDFIFLIRETITKLSHSVHVAFLGTRITLLPDVSLR